MTTEQFYALPMNERAVLVAKDVIAQVKSGRYKPNTGHYLNLIRGLDSIFSEEYELLNRAKGEGLDVKENFHLIPNGCTACAIGATILSCTHLGNKLKFSDLELSITGISDLDKAPIKELLVSVFSPEQLLMIETAFEGWRGDSDRYAINILGVHLDRNVYRVCDAFYDKYDNSTARIIAIYQNIIDNNGVFVP